MITTQRPLLLRDVKGATDYVFFVLKKPLHKQRPDDPELAGWCARWAAHWANLAIGA